MSKKGTTRRTFIKRVGIGGAGILTSPSLFQLCSTYSDSHASTTLSHVFEAKNGTPEQNVAKVNEMMGGIGNFIGNNDIVVIKPNAQWQNAATTNTNNIKGLIELILNRSGGFSGEIIIAENIHFSDPKTKGGWATTERNGDYNLNELITYFNTQGYANVTGYVLQDISRGGKTSHTMSINCMKINKFYLVRNVLSIFPCAIFHVYGYAAKFRSENWIIHRYTSPSFWMSINDAGYDCTITFVGSVHCLTASTNILQYISCYICISLCVKIGY